MVLDLPLPELLVEDPAVAVGQGYHESKWVSENLIYRAISQSTLSATIARIGQLTGSINGAWKVKEWFPLMLKSSQFLGCLPTDERMRSSL